MLGVVILCTAVSMMCFVVSFLIWKKGKLMLVVGFNEEKFTGNQTKLAKAAGLLMSGMGILVLLLPFSLQYLGALTGPLYALTIVCGTLVLLKGAN